MRKILSSVLALLMLLSAFSCLTIIGFAADTALTEKESNDTEATANEIKVAETNIGALQSAKDVDWYKFTSDKDYFTINFNLMNVTDANYVNEAWSVTVYDSAMDVIIIYNPTTSFESPNLPITGTVYVEVKANDNYSSSFAPVNISYTLNAKTFEDTQWESEYNNASGSANLIDINKTYVGALQSAKDVDWYKFTSDKDYFTLNFDLQKITDKNYVNEAWSVTVYDSAMDVIIIYNPTTSFESPNLPITGTVYVEVKANDNYSSSFAPVNISYILTAKTFADTQWESEYNNDSTTANQIEQGKNYKATLYNPKDVDFFKFTATSDAFKVKFSIDLSETSVYAINEGWKMTIFPADSASSVVGNYTVSNIGSFETRTLAYEKGKEYFVRIEAADNYSGNTAPVNAIYNFEVIDATDGKKWEVENGGNDFKWATAVNNNEVVYGNMYSRSDYDYYKISVPTDGVLNFVFNREESDKYNDGWNFALKDAAGNTVYTNSVTTALTLKSENVNVKKGNYYLVVSSGYSAPESHIDYNIQLNYAMHTPKITKIANASNGITVNWNKTAGVESYILYRSEYNASTKKWSGWKAIAKPSASTTSYVDKTAKSGVSYRYTLKGVYGNLSSAYVSTGTLLCLAQPKTTVKAVSNGINVNWTQSAGATGYTVYRMEYNAKTKKWSGWKNMGTAKATKKSWTDKSAKKGVTYKYTVKAVNGKTASSYKSSSSVKR